MSRTNGGEEKLHVKQGDKHHPELVCGPQASHLDSTDSLQKKLAPFATKQLKRPGPGLRAPEKDIYLELEKLRVQLFAPTSR